MKIINNFSALLIACQCSLGVLHGADAASSLTNSTSLDYDGVTAPLLRGGAGSTTTTSARVLVDMNDPLAVAAAVTPEQSSGATTESTTSTGSTTINFGTTPKVSLDADGIKRGSTVINNIGYILGGYDILKGNPLDSVGLVTVDAGYRSAIFSPIEYDPTPDRQFYKPKGIRVVECEGCNMDFSSYTMENTREYVAALSAKASLGIGYKGASFKGSFSLSAGYKNAVERFNTAHEASTCSEISCCVYQGELALFDLPAFSDGFTAALENLQANPTDTNAGIFIKEFGTHYIKKATMGSLYGEQTYFSAESWSEMKDTHLNIEMAASASGSGLTGNIAGGITIDEKEKEAFQNSAEKRSVYSRGAKPPADGDVQKWLDDSSKNPVPTYIELEPIHTLIQHAGAKKVVQEYMRDYCSKVNAESLCNPSEESQFQKVIAAKTTEKEQLLKELETKAKTSTKQIGLARDLTTVPLTEYRSREWIAKASDNLEGPQVFVGYKRTDRSRDSQGRKYGAKFEVYGDIFSTHVDKKEQSNWMFSKELYKRYNRRVVNLPAPTTYTCPTNMAINEFMYGWDADSTSDCWKNRKGDWSLSFHKFKYWCASYKGMTIDTKNKFEQDEGQRCPPNSVLVGFRSDGQGRRTGRANKCREQKFEITSETLKIECAPVRPTEAPEKGARWITRVQNDARYFFTYSSSSSTAMVGIRGDFHTHPGGQKDSIFSFVEESLNGNYRDAEWMKDSDSKTHGTMICPNGKFMVGMKASYNRGNGHGYRYAFAAKCGSVAGYRLKLANGDVFKAGSKTDAKADWNNNWQEGNVNWALECPFGKVLAGFEHKRENNIPKWKILCLTLESV